jgi:flagellar motor switch protein FliM
VERVESNPQLIQIVPPNEVVVLISFDVALGEVRGMINLCIPYNTIERIGAKLSANSWVTYKRREPTPDSIERISRRLKSAMVELRVRLAQTRITTGELIGLRVGDVITTEKDVHSPLLVTVEGVPKYRASPGAFKAHKAIRIEEVIANPSEVTGD